jgi:hypothetical protein
MQRSEGITAGKDEWKSGIKKFGDASLHPRTVSFNLIEEY